MLPPDSDGRTRATPRIERLKTNEIKLGPVRRETLTPQQIERLRKLQVMLAEVDDSPIEKWIDDFRYDADPDREIAVFEAVAEAYQAFCSARPRTLAQKKDAFGLLLDRSGSTDEDSLKNYMLKALNIADAKEVLSYYKMHLVQQLTPFTCGLACVESVSFDLGSPITQAEMLARYKKKLIECANSIEHFGEITGDALLVLLDDLGFEAYADENRGHDHVRDVLLSLSDRQAAMISVRVGNSSRHFVRWAGFQDDHSLLVMDPLQTDEAGNAIASSRTTQRMRQSWAAVSLATASKLLSDPLAQADVFQLAPSGLAAPLFPVVVTAARDQKSFA